MKQLLFFLFIGVLHLSIALAGGPKKIAKSNRSLWPYKINSAPEFDFASKMEMLVFVSVFHTYEDLIVDDSIKRQLGLAKISIASINRWKEEVKKILVANFTALGKMPAYDVISITQPITWQKVATSARSLDQKIPDNLRAWFKNAHDFYDSYLYEQMRLAALFPRTTSEILTLADSEITGFGYNDKQYLLTFDDGPSVAGGTSDKLISLLTENGVNGIFFVLGDMFNARLKASSSQKMHDLFAPMVVGSHGKVHKAHPTYDNWQISLSFTDQLIDSVFPENKNINFFRPPYGQRNDKIVEYLDRHSTRVMLWNIDSQDWNAKISSKEVADRVITLMLLWRKGILLFHDIHPKANVALPVIWKELRNSGIEWIDAKKLR